MAGIVYALVQYSYNQTAGWVKLLCHYPATHLNHIACSLFPLFSLLLSHFKKLKLQLPGGNCKKAIGKMELPSGNCGNTTGKMELPGGNCRNTIGKMELPGGNCGNTIGKMELPGGNCGNTIGKMELPGGNYEKQFFGLLLPMGKLTICTHGSYCSIPYGRASPPARLL